MKKWKYLAFEYTRSATGETRSAIENLTDFCNDNSIGPGEVVIIRGGDVRCGYIQAMVFIADH